MLQTAGNLSCSRLPKTVCNCTTSPAFCAKKRLVTAQKDILCPKRPVTFQNNNGVFHTLITKPLIFLSHKQLIISRTDGEIHHNQIMEIADCFSPSFPKMNAQLQDFIMATQPNYCTVSMFFLTSLPSLPFFFSYSAFYLFLIALLNTIIC